jgi:galactose-1-phosphate uridylyltransferase
MKLHPYKACRVSSEAQDVEHFLKRISRYYESIVMHRFEYVMMISISKLPIPHIFYLWKKKLKKIVLKLSHLAISPSTPCVCYKLSLLGVVICVMDV